MLSIKNTYGLRGVSFAVLHEILKVALKTIPEAATGDIILYLVGDKEIQKLNKSYRKLDQVTDVLSFSYLGEDFGDRVLGEIYIDIKRAKEQAVSFGHNLSKELAFLFSHGLLHIYGYEHSNKAQLQGFEKIQNKVLKKASASLEV